MMAFLQSEIILFIAGIYGYFGTAGVVADGVF